MADKRTRDDKGIPILPDKIADKIKSGRQDWAIEEVMGESAVEQAVEASARAAEPIHAEDLTPMSKAEAARRTTFDGEHLIKAPQTRRVLPAPFRRPVINLSLPWVPKRTWQNVPAEVVEVGDVVPGVGKVTDVQTRVLHETVAGVEGVATGIVIRLVGQGGLSGEYRGMDSVRVFRY